MKSRMFDKALTLAPSTIETGDWLETKFRAFSLSTQRSETCSFYWGR